MKPIFLIALFLVLLPALAFGDTIVLRHGRSIEAEKAWEQDGQIFFYLHGLKMRVTKKAVLRIVKANAKSATPPAGIKENTAGGTKTAKHSSKTEKALKAYSLPVENSLATKSKKPAPTVRWSGFRDICWGTGSSAFSKLKEVEATSGLVEVKEYVRSDEALIMGRAQLHSIVYAFWRNKLYAVTLWTKSRANYLSLRNEVFNQFGIGFKSDQGRERYLWSDRYSDRMLKYLQDDEDGLFWMRSKDLDRLYQLSQIKVPSSYLHAIEAKNLK